jgi:MHS family proline/betaine transporter-like MFS transporter
MSSRLLISTWLGNFFEHYDTALFGFLSAFLAPLIFPQQDPLTALLLTYAIIPLSMLARPAGAIVFGMIGDVHGRGSALFYTLGGMAVISTLMAFTPTFSQAGFLAPLLFFAGRTFQNFFCAGEVMGGAIYLLENAHEKKHDFLSGLYNTSTIGGILLASGGVALLSHSIEWSWRILYLFGSLTLIFAFAFRLNPPLKTATQPCLSLSIQRLWEHKKAFILIIIVSGFNYANYVIALVLMNGFIPLVTTSTKSEMITLNSFLLIFDLCALPFFGWVVSRYSREKMMSAAALGVALVAFPLFSMLPGASLATIIAVRIILVALGVAFCAPFHAWAQTLVPENCRYGIISLGYAIGSQLLGGPTAALSLWAYRQTGKVESLAIYWVLLSLLSANALVYSIYFKRKSILAN